MIDDSKYQWRPMQVEHQVDLIHETFYRNMDDDRAAGPNFYKQLHCLRLCRTTGALLGNWGSCPPEIRGQRECNGSLFSYVSLEDRILPLILCGAFGDWRIRTSIDLILPSVRFMPQKAGPQFRPYSYSRPRCCRRSTASDQSGCCWISSATTCCSVGLCD